MADFCALHFLFRYVTKEVFSCGEKSIRFRRAFYEGEKFGKEVALGSAFKSLSERTEVGNNWCISFFTWVVVDGRNLIPIVLPKKDRCDVDLLLNRP